MPPEMMEARPLPGIPTAVPTAVPTASTAVHTYLLLLYQVPTLLRLAIIPFVS